jgi:Mn-containing catalase
MFLHRKELIQPVNVGTPDARFGTYLLEQFGGPTGASRVTYQCEPRLISGSDQSGRQGE